MAADPRELFVPETSKISSRGLYLRRSYYDCLRKRDNNPYSGRYITASFDGGVSETGRRYKNNIWDKMIKKLDTEKIDVCLFLEYILSHIKDFPSPAVLLSDRNINAYKNQLMTQQVPQLWELEEKQLLTQLSILLSLYPEKDKVLARVLNDDLIGVSPLVRYAFAVAHNCVFLVSDRVKQGAFDQYTYKRFFYEKFYSDRVPIEFIQKAKQ